MEAWWEQAACKGASLELFFPPKGTKPKRAKEICAKCSVIQQCLNDCLKFEAANVRNGGRHGVFGGTSQYERAVQSGDRRPSAGRTVCASGHPFTEDSDFDAAGRRICGVCAELRARKRHKADTKLCVNGHERSPETVAIRRNRAYCLQCERERSQKARRNKRLFSVG